LATSALPGRAAAASATTASADIELRQRHGRAMLGIGLGVQAIGLGWTISATIGCAAQGLDGSAYGSVPALFVYDGVSAAFAPVAATGFAMALDDGTRRGRQRAAAIGLLEGAAYSGVTSALYLAMTGVLNAKDAERRAPICAADSSDPGCWEGPGPGLFSATSAGIHLGVGVCMLIPGLITAAVATTGNGTRLAGPPTFYPMMLAGGGGAGVVLRF